jgi:hypothetical protein
LPHGKVYPGEIRQEKIERSADALRGCHNPRSLSLQVQSCHNARRVTGETNRPEVVKKREAKRDKRTAFEVL